MKYQAQTQQKYFLVFEFVASNELPIDKDSLGTQIFLLCPPWATGHHILGQNRGIFRKSEKLLFQPCQSNNFFELCSNINPLKVRRILHSIFFQIGAFFDPLEQKNLNFTWFTENGLKIFPTDQFLIFQWKSINCTCIEIPIQEKFAIRPFQCQTSYFV